MNRITTVSRYSVMALAMALSFGASTSFAEEQIEARSPRSYGVYPQFPEVKFRVDQLTEVKGGTLLVLNESNPEKADLKVRLFNTSRIPNSPAEVTFLLEPTSSGPVQIKALHDIDYSIKAPQLESKFSYMGATNFIHDTLHPECHQGGADACFIYLIPLAIDLVKSPIMLVANAAVDQVEPMKCAQESLAFLLDAQQIGQVKKVSKACFDELISRVED